MSSLESHIVRPTHLADTVGRTLDPVLRLFSWWWRDPGCLLELCLQHGFLALTTQLRRVNSLQVLSWQVGRSSTCPHQLHLAMDRPLPVVRHKKKVKKKISTFHLDRIKALWPKCQPLVWNPQRSAVPEWSQVAVAVDGVPSQVEACQLGWTFREGLDDTQLVIANVQVDEAGAFGYSCVG